MEQVTGEQRRVEQVTEEQRRSLEDELNSIDSGLYSQLDDDDIAKLMQHKYHTRERLVAATKETLLKYLAGGTVELLWSKLHPGLVHRDLRWPNVVKVSKGDEHTIMLIDLELVGKAGMVCNAPLYPLRHWGDGDGGSVLESDGRYTALSDLRMVGKQLMGALAFDLGTSGRDLQERLQTGQFADAAAALKHKWLTT